jgi:hypothetical protein
MASWQAVKVGTKDALAGTTTEGDFTAQLLESCIEFSTAFVWNMLRGITGRCSIDSIMLTRADKNIDLLQSLPFG